MVFKETLKKLDKDVKIAVDDFFKKAELNQKTENDILLVYIHGFLDRENKEGLNKNKLSEFVFGPGYEGWCADRFYEFFDIYRHRLDSKKEFEKKLKDKKDEAELAERISVDIELLIYLKFWESDLILRQLYNLKNLALGNKYDWEFEPNKFWKKRELIRREIQQPIKAISPLFHDLIEETYSAQIRNAVAHTKYFFLGRNLQLTNKRDNPHYKLYNVPFNDWETRFHKVLLMYNHMIGNFNRINREHADKAADLHNGLALETPKKGKHGRNKLHWILYDEHYKRWYSNS